MAEMTVEQAVEMSKHEVSSFVKRRSEIAALLESQQQTINHQNLQIAKLQEDLIKAISVKE